MSLQLDQRRYRGSTEWRFPFHIRLIGIIAIALICGLVSQSIRFGTGVFFIALPWMVIAFYQRNKLPDRPKYYEFYDDKLVAQFINRVMVVPRSSRPLLSIPEYEFVNDSYAFTFDNDTFWLTGSCRDYPIIVSEILGFWPELLSEMKPTMSNMDQTIGIGGERVHKYEKY